LWVASLWVASLRVASLWVASLWVASLTLCGLTVKTEKNQKRVTFDMRRAPTLLLDPADGSSRSIILSDSERSSS
jgi:hypothetical protein